MTATRWHRAWLQAGEAGLHTKGLPGPDPRLPDEQRPELEEVLRKGALEAGFRTEQWSLARVGALLRERFGVDYRKSRIAEVLHEMEWSRQKPGTRAKERQEGKVRKWRKRSWPAIKAAAWREGTWIAFWDEAGFSERPAVRSTWAPRGETPVLEAHWNWERIATTGILLLSPEFREVELLTVPPERGSINTPRVIAALEYLRQHVSTKVVVLWDGLSGHLAKLTQAYLRRQRGWLRMNRLPGYAPELNPMEQVWGNLRARELANFAPDTLAELMQEVLRGLERIRRDSNLLQGFLRHAGFLPTFAPARGP
jgi:transposase